MSKEDRERILLAISKLSQADQEKLKEELEVTLSETEDTSGSQYAYTQIRTELFKKTDITDLLKPWSNLTAANKNSFHLAWKKANKTLLGYGFTDKNRILKLLVKLISRADKVEAYIAFKTVLEATQSVKDILQDQFPGYTKEALLMVEKTIK